MVSKRFLREKADMWNHIGPRMDFWKCRLLMRRERRKLDQLNRKISGYEYRRASGKPKEGRASKNKVRKVKYYMSLLCQIMGHS